jgi:hypothetical protein
MSARCGGAYDEAGMIYLDQPMAGLASSSSARKGGTMARMALTLVVAGFLTVGGHAEAAVLCARPKQDGTFSTSLKVREQCRSSETQLDPATLGLQGPPGPPGLGQVVRDAAGTFVGTVIDRSENDPFAVIVMRQIGPDVVTFAIRSDGIPPGPNWAPTAMYESADCSGPAFLVGITAPLLPEGRLADGQLYYPAPSPETPVKRTLLSRKSYLGAGQCDPTPYSEPLTDTIPIRVAAMPVLTPPFRVQPE